MEKIKVVRKIDSKGRALLPREAREISGIRPGDRVAFSASDGKVVIVKCSK